MTLARIRAIAVATTIALTGVLVLQGYWLVRGYRDARVAFERRVDQLLVATRERLDPGDAITQQIAALTAAGNSDTVAARAVLDSVRRRIDIDLTRTELPRQYTLVLTSAQPAMQWTDPPRRPTTGARFVALRGVCESCDVRLGVAFEGVGAGTFLAEIAAFVTVSVVLVVILVAGVVVTFSGLVRLRRQHEQHVAFVNNLAHEFRTPLYSISIAGKVLANASGIRDNDELLRHLALIGRAKDRLAKHTERLLDLALVRSDAASIAREPVDLNELVRRVTADLDIVREEAGASLRMELDSKMPVVVGDAERLEHAVANLIDNAFKYGGSGSSGGSGGSAPQVVVRTRSDGTTCSVEVQDSGPGVAPQFRTEIFAPFVRIANGARHDVKGFGLGLSHVQAVAALHGGTISVRDGDAPNGARFILTLPCRRET